MITIVYGEPGSGKTRNRYKLRDKFDARRVIDEWTPGDPLKNGDLALTATFPPYSVPNARAIHIAHALAD